MKELVVEIKPDGSVLVYAAGVAGEACVLPVRRLAEKLGLVEEEEHLPEYYQPAVAAEDEAEKGKQHDHHRS